MGRSMGIYCAHMGTQALVVIGREEVWIVEFIPLTVFILVAYWNSVPLEHTSVRFDSEDGKEDSGQFQRG